MDQKEENLGTPEFQEVGKRPQKWKWKKGLKGRFGLKV